MERRTFAGAVVETTLASNIGSADISIVLSDGSTFPSPTDEKPSVIVIGRGGLNEEKILISARSVNTLTVKQRGYDGTMAAMHTAGNTIDHVLDANAIQNMNDTIYDTAVLNWMGL